MIAPRIRPLARSPAENSSRWTFKNRGTVTCRERLHPAKRKGTRANHEAGGPDFICLAQRGSHCTVAVEASFFLSFGGAVAEGAVSEARDIPSTLRRSVGGPVHFPSFLQQSGEQTNPHFEGRPIEADGTRQVPAGRVSKSQRMYVYTSYSIIESSSRYGWHWTTSLVTPCRVLTIHP